VLPQAAADELVRRALDRNGLRDAREEYAVGGVDDATTTVFTVDADGIAKTVSVYGLGFGDAGGDERTLRRLDHLATRLQRPRRWLPAGVPVTRFKPRVYRGVFVEEDPERAGLLAWPWDDLSPDDLHPVQDAPALSQADLTPQQVAILGAGSVTGSLIASPDGSAAWRLSVRPLLPDEAALDVAAPAGSPAPSAPVATPVVGDEVGY
jgi:hypothetical protein